MFAWTAARQGHAAVQANTGICYDQGRGVAKDDKQAMAWNLKGAQQGLAMAQNNAAFYFEKGRGGVAVDRKAALDLYLKAAHQGMAAA